MANRRPWLGIINGKLHELTNERKKIDILSLSVNPSEREHGNWSKWRWVWSCEVYDYMTGNESAGFIMNERAKINVRK